MKRAFLPLLLALCACDAAQVQGASEQTAATCTGPAEPGMVWIPGGRFTMGEDARYPEEGPPREVEVEGFWMSRTEVTNAEFTKFVATKNDCQLRNWLSDELGRWLSMSEAHPASVMMGAMVDPIAARQFLEEPDVQVGTHERPSLGRELPTGQ